MDDLAELRDILTPDAGGSEPTPDSEDEAPAEPLDGAPLEDDATDDSPEDLSAEDRMAALLQAEAEAAGEEPGEPEDDVAEADAEDEDEGEDDAEIEALLTEARAIRAQRAEQEQLAPYLAVYQTAEQRIAEGKAHYARERARIAELVEADAERAADPLAYRRTHMVAAMNGVIAAEEAWVGQIGQDARNQVQAIREQQSRPAWAAHLAATRQLPPAAVERILQTTDDPRAMPAVADLLVEFRNAFVTERRKATQATRSAAARSVAANQVNSGASGSAPRGKLPDMTGDVHELVALLKMK